MNGDRLSDILNGGANGKAAAVKDQTESPEGEDLGPCASRAMPKGWTALIVKNARNEKKEDVGWRGFQYCHTGFANFQPDGLGFVIEFNEPEKWKMIVRGRNLAAIFTRLMHHKLEWITRADRDFGQDGQSIITDILIERVAEE